MAKDEHDEREARDDETSEENLPLDEEQADDVRGGASQGGKDISPWTTTHGSTHP